MKNEVIVITLNGYNDYNRSLINNIKTTSSYDVILGWDEKSGKKKDNMSFINSYKQLLNKFGSKINNFNGRWTDNPSKLGSIYWFSKNSEYKYMWLIEDDVFIRNSNKFIDSYNSINSDVICKRDDNLPFWYPKYRVGDKNKVSNFSPLAHLYVVRLSRHACLKIIEEIINSNETNHHELWIPYVIQKYNLLYSDIIDYHKKGLRTNPKDSADTYHNLENYDICHPYKHKISGCLMF